MLALAGCATATIDCPDGKSMMTWRGTNLLSQQPTTVSCNATATGAVGSVSGTDLSQIAGLVATYLATQGVPAPVVAQPRPPVAAPSPTQ